MTRSKIRENVFKMLFRAEFHDADDMKEQLDLFDEELENPSESELFYINSKSKGILEHRRADHLGGCAVKYSGTVGAGHAPPAAYP